MSPVLRSSIQLYNRFGHLALLAWIIYGFSVVCGPCQACLHKNTSSYLFIVFRLLFWRYVSSFVFVCVSFSVFRKLFVSFYVDLHVDKRLPSISQDKPGCINWRQDRIWAEEILWLQKKVSEHNHVDNLTEGELPGCGLSSFMRLPPPQHYWAPRC